MTSQTNERTSVYAALPLPDSAADYHEMLEALAESAHELGYIKGIEAAVRYLVYRNPDFHPTELKLYTAHLRENRARALRGEPPLGWRDKSERSHRGPKPGRRMIRPKTKETHHDE